MSYRRACSEWNWLATAGTVRRTARSLAGADDADAVSRSTAEMILPKHC